MTRHEVVLTVLNQLADTDFGFDFAAGQLDCCQFAGEVARRLTGKNPAELFDYSSAGDADQLIAEYGDLQNIVSSRLGAAVSDFDALQDGDPCMVDLPMIGDLLGVKFQSDIVCKSAHKVVRADPRYFVAGWPL